MALSAATPFESSEPLGAPGVELVAVDLTNDPLWCAEELAASGPTAFEDGYLASSHGLASPMGFSFALADGSDANGELLRVSVHHHSDQSAIDRAGTRLRKDGPTRTVRLAGPGPSDSELTLVVGPMGAELFADEAVWATLAEPVLLYVALYARYCAVERHFLQLQVQARRARHHSVETSRLTQRRVTETSLDVRDRVSDWIFFSGPAADPRRSCTSEAAITACETLAAKLDIATWAKGIDGLVEDVEQTYETLSDKLFHYRLFLWGASLELVVVGLIVVLILR